MKDGDGRAGRRRHHPLIVLLASQMAAAMIAGGVAVLAARGFGVGLPTAATVAAWSLLAAAFGVRFGLDRWWLVVQVLFPPGLVAGLWAPLPAWTYLVAFAALLSVQWNAARGRVPLYLTNRKTWDALAGLLPERRGLRILDAGSGLGGTVVALARRRPDSLVTGVESAPLPYVISRLRVALAGLGKRATIAYGDYRRRDLGDFDVVYCFLSPAPMPDVFAQARRQMKAGALLISNSFDVPGCLADRAVNVGDRRGTRLMVWRMPGTHAGGSALG